MDIFPAIDLLAGKCVRLFQGDYDQSQVFGEDPAEVAKQWIKAGSKHLHLVDLDGAKVGHPVNLPAIRAIVTAVREISTEPILIQVGGGLRDVDSVDTLLQLGVSRVILGTVAVEQPELVRTLCQTYPGQIMVGIDARNGQVATRGWLETSTVKATDLAIQMSELGVAGIIYTDIHRDGTMAGPNLESLKELANTISVPVIASGGVSSLTDLFNLLTLEPLGVTGAIVGKAIYTGDINLQEAIQGVGSARYQDIPPDFGSQVNC